MRPSALIPALLCAGALVLSFLCLFAGQKKNFMENYHLLPLNTSRIGYNIINTTSENTNNPLTNLFNNITDSLGNELNEAAGDIADALGIDDFYSVHILDYCYGDYTPAPLGNSTLKQSDIHKNVTGCSNRTAMYEFNVTRILEQALNDSGVDVTLGDLNWPDDIQKGIDGLNALFKAQFVLYCIAIGFIAIALLSSLWGLFPRGRLTACCNFMVSLLAFLAIGLASALVTAVIVKGSDVINKYGKEIGIESHKGGKFMALTWAATGLMFLVVLDWIFEFCIGHRKHKAATYTKHG